MGEAEETQDWGELARFRLGSWGRSHHHQGYSDLPQASAPPPSLEAAVMDELLQALVSAVQRVFWRPPHCRAIQSPCWRPQALQRSPHHHHLHTLWTKVPYSLSPRTLPRFCVFRPVPPGTTGSAIPPPGPELQPEASSALPFSEEPWDVAPWRGCESSRRGSPAATRHHCPTALPRGHLRGYGLRMTSHPRPQR